MQSLAITKPNNTKISSCQQYFHCFIVFISFHILFKLILECVIFRTSATFRAAVLIRGEAFIRGWFMF